MFRLLIEKELKSILFGPKFPATFLICSLLILLSVVIGIQDYKAAVKQYEAAVGLQEQVLSEEYNWNRLGTLVYRKPDPMQIFVSGVTNDVGRFSPITAMQTVRLERSHYSEDPIYAVFRFFDLSFIYKVVLSLFAVLFTFNAVNGERENGSLQLIFSNAVPRARFIIAKFIGSWLGLVLPLMIPLLAGLLIITLSGVPLDAGHWSRIVTFIGLSTLYFTFFIAIGVFVSSLTKQSSVSFLILLVTWVAYVLIIPRVGMMAASKLVPVSSVAEIDGQIDAYSDERWDQYSNTLTELFDKRRAETEGMSEAERETYRDDHLWEWTEESDEARKSVQTDISSFTDNLENELRLKKNEQERLAFLLARFSPVSAYQLASMQLAGTHSRLKSEYETAINEYKSRFLDYAEQKAVESGGSQGGMQISIGDDGVQINTGEQEKTIDTSDMPRFEQPGASLGESLYNSVPDFAVLSIFTVIMIAGAFWVFMRYDVR